MKKGQKKSVAFDISALAIELANIRYSLYEASVPVDGDLRIQYLVREKEIARHLKP